MSVKIISFNCHSARANFDIINSLSKECDIMILQETILNDDNCLILNNILGFNYAYVSSTRRADIFVGRSSGGLAVLWKNFDGIKISPVYATDRLMGLEICVNEIKILLGNIYCNCDYGNYESVVEYLSVLADLENFADVSYYDYVCVAGDYNCDPTKGRFFPLLRDFLNNSPLEILDISNLPNDSFTYISNNDRCSTSFIDHVLGTDESIVSDFSVLYGSTFSDHIPLSFTLRLPLVDFLSRTATNYIDKDPGHLVAWSKVSKEDVEQYEFTIDNLVDGYYNDALSCNRSNCDNVNHLRKIDEAFIFMKEAIFEASDACFFNISNHGTFKIVPGWNEHCKDLYNKSKDLFNLWITIGRPRHGMIFEDMKDARIAFRRAMNYCKSNEVKLRKDKFIKSFNGKDKRNFWKDVKKFNPSSSSNVIDGYTDPVEINKIFSSNYKRILDDQSCYSNYPSLDNNDYNDWTRIYFQAHNIDESILKLKIGLGFDRIHAYHLKYAGISFRDLLGRFLSSCLLHSYLPSNMTDGVIRPVLKGNSCKMKSENYRPVMSSSLILKTLEYCLLPTLNKCLEIDSLQFGFQAGSSCDHAITIVKEVVSNYKINRTNVYSAALDLSKAYDKTNHDILIQKLIDAHVPISIVKNFQYLFCHTNVYVRFNGTFGAPWRVKNGLRQGGCASSLLFSYYIDEALKSIKSLNVGCQLNGIKVNIVAYADDILLMCPSRHGLQILINEIYKIFDRLCLKTNSTKSKYIVFKHKPNITVSGNIYLNNCAIERVYVLKYLGVHLSDDLDIKSDCDRVLKSFLKQFNSMYNKFNFLPINVLSFLFKTYTTSFYGINLWFEQNINNNVIRKLEVAYHKAIKKILGMEVWRSNHDACEMMNIDLFKHLLTKRMVNFYFSAIFFEM